MSKNKWQLPITIVFIFMGVLLSLQYHAQRQIASDLYLQRPETLIAMIRDLSDKRYKLALEIIDLDKQLRLQRESDRDEQTLIENINAELEKLNVVAGTSPLQGSGITVTISNDMPILYIDIISIINELWAAGAEAIAVNEQRITNSSSIFYAEDEHNAMYITVNNYKMDFPIRITALGNPNNLEKGLTIPGGIMDNLALFQAYPLLEKNDELTVPSIENPPFFYFMSEYKPPENPVVSAAAGQNI